MRPRDDARLFFQRQVAILDVMRVDHIGHRLDVSPVGQAQFQPLFQVGGGNQLAFAQIGQRLFLAARRGAQGQPVAAGVFLFVQGQHQPRLFLSAAMVDRIHAETARIAVQAGLHPLRYREPRVPKK